MRSSFPVRSILLAGLLPCAGANAQFGPTQQFFCESPRSVELADFDGDGAKDLLIASREGLGFYRNTDGLGAFAAPVFLGTLETVACVADLDGDGAIDVLASREQNSGLFWFRNDGSGTFGNAQSIANDLSAEEIHAADLDADGDQDVFFVLATGSLQVCFNTDGYGNYSLPMEAASMVQMAHANALDVDGDGRLDLTFSSRVVNQVGVCRGDDGWFFPQEQLTTAGLGKMMDVDNDGFADALLANTAGGQVAWQRNIGGNEGLLAPVVLDPAFDSPAYITASDLDGDGDRDVIVTSNNLSEVAWFENTDGQGSFGPHGTVSFGIPVSAIAAGDVDHDGDEDLFVASGDLNKVIWYANVTNTTGGIMGRVFNDINGDGIFNGNDHGLVNMRVECGDIGATYTNASGYYWFDAVPAGYTVMKPAEDLWSFTTTDTYQLTVPAVGSSQHNDFGLQANMVISELAPTIGSAPLRCGTSIAYWASVINQGNQVCDVELSLDLDNLSSFIGADPAPASVQNGVATWIFPHVQPTHVRQVQLVVHLPGSDHVGETLHDVLNATAFLNGAPYTVDTRIYSPILLCAVDPNDKQVSPAGVGEEHLTPIGSTFNYHVRFQNTGNAEARTVVILDTLDVDLDHNSLRVLDASHSFHALLQEDGVLRFTFENINLPDSGSDYIGSQGFVRFVIDHLTDAPIGTVLNNTADIYFDNNAPVITNTTENKLSERDVTAVNDVMMDDVELLVMPNPARGTATVRLGNAFQGQVELQLFDAAGSVVAQLARRSSTILLEQGSLPKGIYILRAADERGTERTTRVVFE